MAQTRETSGNVTIDPMRRTDLSLSLAIWKKELSQTLKEFREKMQDVQDMLGGELAGVKARMVLMEGTVLISNSPPLQLPRSTCSRSGTPPHHKPRNPDWRSGYWGPRTRTVHNEPRGAGQKCSAEEIGNSESLSALSLSMVALRSSADYQWVGVSVRPHDAGNSKSSPREMLRRRKCRIRKKILKVSDPVSRVHSDPRLALGPCFDVSLGRNE
ncbi:hypothetical protein H6P81_008462 [Aristolochia fimbriata]|uniref:Uncharacterized protein n=1 Tax=Aristolochia fimbriata TaxID=158543 RepID=A0AAV7ELM7_ARIFI|nr:hypothetical protein H6P81_008462 [Aristolochia fimbriata]